MCSIMYYETQYYKQNDVDEYLFKVWDIGDIAQ